MDYPFAYLDSQLCITSDLQQLKMVSGICRDAWGVPNPCQQSLAWEYDALKNSGGRVYPQGLEDKVRFELEGVKLALKSELERMHRDMQKDILSVEKRLVALYETPTSTTVSLPTSSHLKLSEALGETVTQPNNRTPEGKTSVERLNFDTSISAGALDMPLLGISSHCWSFNADDQAELTRSRASSAPNDTEFSPSRSRATSDESSSSFSAPSSSHTTLHSAKGFRSPSQETTESTLLDLATQVLTLHGSVPIGKMGSLLHKLANDHTLPSLLKERYGGLKNFLQTHKQFAVDNDHPFNPHVRLISLPPSEPVVQGAPVPKFFASTFTDVVLPLPLPAPTGSPVKSEARGKRRKSKRCTGALDVVALDCETVLGSACIARCTVVDASGQVLLDKYVRSESMSIGVDAWAVQREVQQLLKNRTVVGNALAAQFLALTLSHPDTLTRDFEHYPLPCPWRSTIFCHLVQEELGINIQGRQLSSLERARLAIALYACVHEEWENGASSSLFSHQITHSKDSDFDMRTDHDKELFGRAIWT